MIPKKPRLIVKQLSEDLNISETLIDNLVSFYYKDLKTNMSGLTHTHINVYGLGVFYVITKKVKKNILSYIDKLNNPETALFKNYRNAKGLEDRLIDLKRINEQIKNNEKDKEDFLKLKTGRDVT